MRLKPSIWWAISILLFAASAYFWNVGEKKRVADHAAHQQKHLPLLKAVPQVPPAASVAAAATQTNAATKTAPHSYRVSNTTAPLAQMQRNNHAILLRNALIDTTKPIDSLNIPEKWRAKGEPGSYIVQLDHPLDKAFYDSIKAAGATFVSYIPNNAALIKADADVAKKLPYATQLAYQPYYKVDPKIITGNASAYQFFRFTAFAGSHDTVAKAIAQAGGEIVAEENMVFGPSLVAKVDGNRLADIAQSIGVQAIEPAVARSALNDLTRARLRVAANSTNATNYLGLTGQGITVNINDTGVDTNHPDFFPVTGPNSRVIGDPNAWVDFEGHGTHVAGIIAGNGDMSTNVVNAIGSTKRSLTTAPFYFPQQFHGKAPKAKLFAQAIDSFLGPFVTDTYLQTNAAANTNVLISNNSWGYVGADPYSMPTASYDAAVRDALPGTNGSQPILYVFAAGNSGGGDDSGQNASSDTIVAPAGGKNVITVGAIESLRNITNTVRFPDSTGTNFTTNAVWAGMTDSESQVASFSSRGNVGIDIEGEFGRFKPDVVAPGVFIVSTRMTNWVDPSYFSFFDFHDFPGQSLDPGASNLYSIFVPNDAIRMDIGTFPNSLSPDPFPLLPIFADLGPTAPTFRGNGAAGFGVTSGSWTVQIKGPGNHTVAYDAQVFVERTNTFGNYFQVLSNINHDLGPYYRYESGTSMAAPAVSGVLALMQEYMLRIGVTNPSPALMKALLINGARSLGNLYDYNVRRIEANDQGWGLVNLPASIPSTLNVNSGPTVFYDQVVTNALATGQSQTYTVSSSNPNAPLRITLVWTDPPGNPAAGVKLVNDLDLVVTNVDTGEVFVGNNFAEGDLFTEPDDPTFAPITDSDTVNNVENVYLFAAAGAPLGSNYTVTVRGSRVNVNAVTKHPDNVVQDFALVMSSADPAATVTATSQPRTIAPARLITVASNGVALLYQRVGANTPLLSTPLTGVTNGMIDQWHFFIFTNTAIETNANFTNVAFVTFMPPNLSQSRLLEPPGVGARGPDGADIDLYVSTNAALLDLDPVVIAASSKSTNRGGTEFVTFTNSSLIGGSTNGQVYYIGVKSEDQQASEFGFFGFATDKPFGSLDQNGQLEINFTPAPIVIPDGFPGLPSRPPALAFGIVVPSGPGPQTIRRVVISDDITHELLGDLYGTITLNGRYSVTLNNHSSGSVFGATNFVFTYDDNAEGDVTVANGYPGHNESSITNRTVLKPDYMHTDGPGTLQDFAGKKALGVWMFTMTDNALTHTGQVNTVHGWIDANPPTNVLHQVRTIAGNGWFYDFLEIPDDATNLNIAVTYVAGTGPVDIYLRKDFFPNPTNFTAASTNIVAPGGFLNVTNPPLSGGFWVYGIHNNSGTAVTLAIDITITRSLTPDLVQTLTNKTGTVLLDDAITSSKILITNELPVVGVEVGVRIDHPRLSDLSIELVSPQGTHVMLFEERGRTTAMGLGLDTTTDPIYTIFTEDTNKASQLIKFALPPYAAVSEVSTNRVIFSNSFDGFGEGSYLAGSVLDGWTVLTNQAGVEFEPELNTSPDNYLALGSASITRTLPTITGKSYLLTHAYHGPNIFDWWTADGNVKDIINTNNNGTFTNLDGSAPLYTAGEVGEAWHFDGTNTEVIINTNACNFGTNDFTVEFWMQTIAPVSAGYEMAVMGKRPTCDANNNFWDIRMGGPGTSGQLHLECVADGDVSFGSVIATTNINDGLWHHVAVRRDEAELDIFIDGQFNNGVVAPGIAFISNSVPFVIGQSICQSADGTHPFAGNIDEVSVYQRSVSPAEIYDIWAAGHAGKRTTTSVLPNISYEINGGTNQTLISTTGNTNFVTGPGDSWQTNTIGFTATNDGTQFTISGNALGMLLDDIVCVELPNTNYNNYFLPEESLSAFHGENAAGYWTLEIHDNRAGQAGTLLDWELNLTYSSTNVNLITLNPGSCTNATAPANGYVYFAVDVPALAKFATNTLNNAGPQPLSLIFNQTALPNGTSAGDSYLLAGVTAGTWKDTLSKNSGPPFLQPGNRYFLAVQNTSPVDQPFCLQVDFDVNTNFSITSLDDPPVSGSTIPTNVLAGSVQYYYYDISNDSAVASFEILNPTADVDMVISHTLPLPDSNAYDYGSFNAGTNDEFIVVRTNSQPVALTAGRWYITVYNSLTNPPNITYTIRAQQSPFDVVIFPIDDGVANQGQIGNPGFSLDSADELRFYSFEITDPKIPAVEFVISNLTGNCDLLARLNDWPTPSQFDFGSFNAGLTDERLVITTNSTRTNLVGIWYLAIPNNDPGIVNFDIAATTLPAGSVPFPLIASSSARFSTANGGSFTFSWHATAGQTYYVDMSTDVIHWQTIAKITATSNTATFNDVRPPNTARYYRLRFPQ
jgi:subtilisin-like proprotein convertase family protein